MAYTTINKSSDYFNTKLYTGNGTDDTAITGVNFQTDLLWIKERSSTSYHNLQDAVRGVTKQLISNETNAEETSTSKVKSFDSDGFTLGTSGAVNENTQTYVSWNWKANGTGSANTDGTISSTVSANTTSGFSIVSWTHNGGNSTIGHGLGVAPKMIITKERSSTGSWNTYHVGSGNGNRLVLQGNNANISTSLWNSTSPTSSVFSFNDGLTSTMIAYCFAEKTGYSKFGSYTGNGNADGTFIYTGFKPAFTIIKRTDSTSNWLLYDNKREGYNQVNDYLNPDNGNAEGGGDNYLDLLSNGFKTRVASQSINVSGASYIYMCFASAPLVGTNNVPANAR